MPLDPLMPRVAEGQPESRGRLALALTASALIGLVLRLWNLPDQILGGDELHLVRAILRWPVRKILVTYGFADTSIPLTALYRWLLDRGATFSEIDFRLPALACGGLALAVLPWTFARRLDRSAVVLYGGLLAVSPSLVLYSRIARSYLPMVLCGFCAVLAFEAWWRTRTWKLAALYVGFGALATWIHLGAATFVTAPFLFAAGDLVIRRQDWRRKSRDLVAVGASLVLAFAAFLLPARRSLARLVAAKRVDQSVGAETIGGVLQVDAGTVSVAVSVLFWIVALGGLVLLLRDHRRLGAFLLTVSLGHAAGIALLSPKGMSHAVILHRYLLPTLPFVLLWVAYGLGRLWGGPAAGGGGPRIARRGAVLLFLGLLLWTSPFLLPGTWNSSFLHHNHFVQLNLPRVEMREDEIPALYGQLPPGPVLEFPWPTTWEMARSFYAYQTLHGHRVLVSAPYDLPRHPQIRFRNEVPPTPEAILGSPARLLIVHLSIVREEWAAQAPGRPEKPGKLRHRRLYRRAGLALANQLTKAWGLPDFADDRVRAWDLEKVRRGST